MNTDLLKGCRLVSDCSFQLFDEVSFCSAVSVADCQFLLHVRFLSQTVDFGVRVLQQRLSATKRVTFQVPMHRGAREAGFNEVLRI